MTTTTPFKFLEPYGKEDHDTFFGRDREIEELYEMVYQTDLILVTGRSGTGKTSLIHCGLSQKMLEHQWNPFYLRRNGDFPKNIVSVVRDRVRLKLNNFNSDSLAECVENCVSVYFKPVYLILDQFEEIFILSDKDKEKEKAELKALAQSLLELQEVPNCKVIIVIREEYLAYLFDLESVLPNIYDFKIRLEPMGKTKIIEVLKSSFEKFNISVDSHKSYENIYQNIAGGKLGVDLAYLQIYLDMFYQEDFKRTYLDKGQDPRKDTTLGHYPPLEFSENEITGFGELNEVLTRFLDKQQEEISNILSERFGVKEGEALVSGLLNALITEQGTKRPVSMAYRGEENRLTLTDKTRILPKEASEEVVDYFFSEFLGLRLLRQIDGYLELAHDSLAALINERRTIEQERYARMSRRLESLIESWEDYQLPVPRDEIPLIIEYRKKHNVSAEINNLIERSLEQHKEQDRLELIRNKKELALLSRSLATECVFKASSQEDRTTELRLLEVGNYIDKNNLRVAEQLVRNYFLQEGDLITPYRRTYCSTIGDLKGMNLSPSGRFLCLAGKLGILVFELTTFKEVSRVQINNENLVLVDFYDESEHLLIVMNRSGEAILLDWKTTEREPVFTFNPAPKNALFHKRRNWLLVYSGVELKVIETNKNKENPEFKVYRKFDSRISSLNMDDNGEYVIVGLESGKILKLNTHDWEQSVIQEDRSNLRFSKLAYSPNRDMLIVGGYDYRIKKIGLSALLETGDFPGHTKQINDLAFSPQGNRLASASGDRTIKIFNAYAGKEEYFWQGMMDSVSHLRWNNSGSVLVSAENNGIISFWDFDYEKKDSFPKTIKGLNVMQKMTQVRFTSDGVWIVGSSETGTIYVWRVETAELHCQLYNPKSNRINTLSISSDDKKLIAGENGGLTTIWDLEKIVNSKGNLDVDQYFIKTLDGNTSDVVSVSMTKEADLLATADYWNTICIWDLDKMEVLHTLKGHDKMVFSVSFSKEDERLVSTSWDKKMILWDARKGHKIYESYIESIPIYALFSRNGKFIFVACEDNTVKIFSAESGEEKVSLSGHSGGIVAMTEIPELKQLITVCREGLIKIWDYEEVEEKFTFVEACNNISSVSTRIVDGVVNLAFTDNEEIQLRVINAQRIIDNTNCASIAGELTPFELEQLNIESLLPSLSTIDPKELPEYDYFGQSEEKMFNMAMYYFNKRQRAYNISNKEDFRLRALFLLAAAEKRRSIYSQETYEELMRKLGEEEKV